MPMIDVYVPADLLAADDAAQLATDLTWAVLRAEGVAAPGPFHLDNTAAFVHRLPADSVASGSTASARAVRVQIVTPPAALSRDGQRQIAAEATELIDATVVAGRRPVKTWVILTEAAEGGWGIDGTAYGVEEFAALAHTAGAEKEGA
jgi:phenylpyruvate tautomerase PptA (4-oxalocrotonate tautomerase family)